MEFTKSQKNVWENNRIIQAALAICGFGTLGFLLIKNVAVLTVLLSFKPKLSKSSQNLNIFTWMA